MSYTIWSDNVSAVFALMSKMKLNAYVPWSAIYKINCTDKIIGHEVMYILESVIGTKSIKIESRLLYATKWVCCGYFFAYLTCKKTSF